MRNDIKGRIVQIVAVLSGLSGLVALDILSGPCDAACRAGDTWSYVLGGLAFLLILFGVMGTFSWGQHLRGERGMLDDWHDAFKRPG